jgi:hypothetical protein
MTTHIRHLVRQMFTTKRTSATTEPVSAQPLTPAIRAVLIDLDNIGLPPKGRATEKLAALLSCCEHGSVIASGRDINFAAYREACLSLGVPAFESPAIPDGADHALLAAASALAASGVTEFTIISGDHAFAKVPGELHVVLPERTPLAMKLEQKAASVQRVDLHSLGLTSPKWVRPPRSRAPKVLAGLPMPLAV